MVRYCLELPYSSVRHFPAGSYHEQMATWGGRVEMQAMNIVQRAWYMFEHLSASEWKDGDLRMAKWMSEKPQPQPTDRANEIIAVLWGLSWWVMHITVQGAPDG